MDTSMEEFLAPIQTNRTNVRAVQRQKGSPAAQFRTTAIGYDRFMVIRNSALVRTFFN